MNTQTLMLKAAASIEIDEIPHIFDFEKRVIHRELSAYVIRSRYYRNRSLSSMCSCGLDAECLCYFIKIRDDFIDQHWGEGRYITLGDLCKFE